MDQAEQHYRWLLQASQVDLEKLDRERLEDLFLGLLKGQVLAFEVLGTETRQSQIIQNLQRINERLQDQIIGLNEALKESMDSLVALDGPREQGELEQSLVYVLEELARGVPLTPDLLLMSFSLAHNRMMLSDECVAWWTKQITPREEVVADEPTADA